LNKLVVLWKDGDKVNAEHMILMYTLNAKIRNWWDEVTLVIWGSSGRLVTEDEGIALIVKKMMEEGVIVRACKACAEGMHTVEKLEDMGVDVVYIGKDFTDYLKNTDTQVITL
jgi:hypothetical protein